MSWTVCCLAFHGSFRIHELLSKANMSFDATTTLLGRDVRLVNTSIEGQKEEVLVIHLKSPKEEHLNGGINVELFATGGFSCPITTWKNWRGLTKTSLPPTKPVFRLPNGKGLTGAYFNQTLKTLLGLYVNYDKKCFLSHSFRVGMASMMAAAGC